LGISSTVCRSPSKVCGEEFEKAGVAEEGRSEIICAVDEPNLNVPTIGLAVVAHKLQINFAWPNRDLMTTGSFGSFWAAFLDGNT
jgi:hypothetical protein